MITAPHQRSNIIETEMLNNSGPIANTPERALAMENTNRADSSVSLYEVDYEMNIKVPHEEASVNPEENRELLEASKETNVPPGANIEACVTMEENIQAKISQNLCLTGTDKSPSAVKKTSYSFNQNNYSSLKEAMKGAEIASRHTKNLSSSENLAKNSRTDTEELSNNRLSEDGARDHMSWSSNTAYLHLPLHQASTLSADDLQGMHSETLLPATYDDAASLVSDGEHGRKILHPLEAVTMYDPAPISLGSELQDLHSPLCNSSEGLFLDCAAVEGKISVHH